MSRITPHCACQITEENIDEQSKAYSILPNYFPKCENNSQKLLSDAHLNKQNNQNSKNHKLIHSTTDCKICENYENIEHFLSGSFRPHSCPTEDNEICIGRTTKNDNLTTATATVQEKYKRKCSKHSLKYEKQKCHDQIHFSKVTERHNNHNLNQTEAFINHRDKKPSCGLKYIIFQKLSIMTHFLTKNKHNNSNNNSNNNNNNINNKQLSEENIFKENRYQTKRSKSFNQVLDNNNNRTSTKEIKQQKQKEEKMYKKTKDSDNSNYNDSSIDGSIDAHAGSPITRNNNFFSRSIKLDEHGFSYNGNNIRVKEEWKKPLSHGSPEIKEFSHKRNHSQHKPYNNSSHIDPSGFFLGHHNHSCQNCLYPFQPPCHQLVYEQMCRSHYCTHSPLPFQFPSCHHYCHNHSHVFMPPSFSQSPSICCNQSNYFCPSSNGARSCFHQCHPLNVCQFENRARSTLCNSCHLKNTKRCQSETFNDTQHNVEPLNINRQCNQNSNNNVRYKLKSENKVKPSKHSPSNHCKSVSSSIPPPPPPPPSSLYSANDLISHKGRHKKHKTGKLCENCDITIPHPSHSPDCTNNVQNIIYSHLNNTVTRSSSKLKSDILSHHPQLSSSYDDHVEIAPKTIKYKSNKGKIAEKSDKENDKDNNLLSSSIRRETGYTNQRKVFDRCSADMLKENPTDFKPRFLSKTPETYKSKHDRRHKKHQYETHRISKHKSISTTREYKFVDSDLFYRDDSMDSPEAGSFVYNSISPLVQNNVLTVVPKKVSSFNNRQHYNYKEINYGKTELVRKAFQENMLSLREVGWYWGPLSFTEAESLMENKANGTFLVRDSGHDTYFLSLTFRVREATYHTRIEYSQGTFSFWSQPESHSATTIVEFIDKAVAHSQSGKFHYFLLTNVPGQPPMEVSLLYPISRHQIVHSLKHMSRFVILSHIRKDHISALSVPPVLRTYLLEKQYYISNLEEFNEMTADCHPLSYKPSTLG